MTHKYYCTNCGTPVLYGDRFCMGCGVNFTWVEQPVQAQSASTTFSLTHTSQKQSSGNEPVPDNHQMESPRQLPQDQGSHAQQIYPSAEGSASPLSTEISRLLESFFDKRTKCNKA